MRSTVAALLVALISWNVQAQSGDRKSWQSLSRLAPGQAIEVVNKKGESWKGTFAKVSRDSIELTAKQQSVTVPRAEVSRVRLRSGRHLKYTLIGMGIGAGAGAGLGAAGGESLAETSGGDFRNLKPAIIGVSCAVGALVGALVGSLIGDRHTTVYQAK